MNCLVTGCAGFIGSHLCERLLADGHRVVGMDCFTAYYPRPVKERNIAPFNSHPNFRFLELDLTADPLGDAVGRADVVFHLAAMPGLNKSWTDFDLYARHNLTATHRLLEAVKGRSLKKFVYASTSSVYGRYASGDESLPTRPSSPYGITKLAGEQLCRVHHDEFGLPAVVLRYFSVYGPRQRPDMGYHLFINAVLQGKPITLTGDGLQVRGNTYVGDCVEATMQAADAMPGEVFNLGGGELTTVIEVIRKIEYITGRTAIIERHPPRKGDQLATGADVGKLYRHIGWKPTTGLEEGLTRQVEWQRGLIESRRGVGRALRAVA
ncbi:MAG TPA: NAD-dependent epimerase/dehydratase family protein [Fimbriiglobus sp.]|nr:NAD-dependent epimerase/dehydratase family protein [Fimbriiglobus sp.]